MAGTWVLSTLLTLVGSAAMAQQIPFKPLAGGAQSGLEERREAIARTAEEWTALWKEHAAGQPLPKVDFTTSMVVGVFLGTRPTAGVSVEITRVEREGDGLVVTYRERAPGPGQMAAQMLTMPFQIVTTDRAAGRVRFTRDPGR